MNSNRLLLPILFLLFSLSCARQTAPTGGPKDTIPPVLISSSPRTGQLLFNENTIELNFNEYIILNNAKEQILITPDIGKKYDIVAKKKKVTIKLENQLTDSTTYLINFRDAVQDITEKNPARNLKLAFSTGHYIDSMSLMGTVYDLNQNKEIKDATVALYKQDTFNIFKHKPVYITKSNEKGVYSFEYLKPGKYYLYAFEDKNRNLIVDSRNESYGFQVDSINLIRPIKNKNVYTIRLDARPLKITSARPYNTYYNIKTSKGLYDYRIISETDSIISAFSDRTNIRVYNTFDQIDSVKLITTLIDSIGNRLDTTLYAKFTDRKQTPESFEYKAENFKIIANKAILMGNLSYTKPLLETKYDSIFYQVDTLTRIAITSADITFEPKLNRATISKAFNKSLLTPKPTPTPTPTTAYNQQRLEQPRGQRQMKDTLTALDQKRPNTTSQPTRASKPIANQLFINKATLISIELDSSKAQTIPIKPILLEETGIIIVEAKTSHQSFIIQLLDKNFNVISEKRNATKITFEDLMPGDYLLRAIVDKDRNGKWSAGNFYKRIEPESIIYYRNEKNNANINLKANWELGPLLIKF